MYIFTIAKWFSQVFVNELNREHVWSSLAYQLETPIVTVMIILNSTGWWFVSLNGHEGWAPSSYLEPLNGLPSITADELDEVYLESDSEGKTVIFSCCHCCHIHTRWKKNIKNQSVILYSFCYSCRPILLRYFCAVLIMFLYKHTHACQYRCTYSIVTSHTIFPPWFTEKTPPPKEIWYAKRDYKAELEDELSFVKGAPIEITNKSISGWWTAKYVYTCVCF